jgi:hypothetical protein
MPAFVHNGTPYILGRTISTLPKQRLRKFGEYVSATDIASIPPYDRWQANLPILDQSQVGSCTAHALAQAIMKARDLAGMTYVALSPDSLYSQIDRDTDQGSDPADGITALQQAGICTLADVPDNFVLWSNISAQAKQAALRFRLSAAGVYTVASFAELVLADYLGFATILTINVGNNFNPDSTGIVGYAPGTANHCVSGGEGYKVINGQPAYRFRNSWTTSWGVNGCGWFTARYVDQQPQVEMFAIKWVLSDPIDPNNPPQGV